MAEWYSIATYLSLQLQFQLTAEVVGDEGLGNQDQLSTIANLNIIVVELGRSIL